MRISSRALHFLIHGSVTALICVGTATYASGVSVRSVSSGAATIEQRFIVDACLVDTPDFCMSLLRSEQWIELSRANVDAVIDLSLPEHAIEGQARVIDVRVASQSHSHRNRGREITATFRSRSNNLRRVRLDGEKAMLTATASHPLFCSSAEEWASVGSLVPGDELKTTRGHSVVSDVIRLEQHEWVFNLEIERDHEYYVGQQTILAHNMCAVRRAPADIGIGRRTLAERPWTTKPGHHQRVALDTNVMLNLVGRDVMPRVVAPRAGYSIKEFSRTYSYIREAQRAGVTLIVPRPVVRELLRQGVDKATLRAYMRAFNMRVGSWGDRGIARAFRDIGLDTHDARIMSSAVRDRAILITFDKRSIINLVNRTMW